jgi:hypothetical protein
LGFTVAGFFQHRSPTAQTTWLEVRMTPMDHKIRLLVYKTALDQDKFQLLEMSRRYIEIGENLPDAITGEPYVHLDHYLKHLRNTLNACEAVRTAIDKRLTELE